MSHASCRIAGPGRHGGRCPVAYYGRPGWAVSPGAWDAVAPSVEDRCRFSPGGSYATFAALEAPPTWRDARGPHDAVGSVSLRDVRRLLLVHNCHARRVLQRTRRTRRDVRHGVGRSRIAGRRGLAARPDLVADVELVDGRPRERSGDLGTESVPRQERIRPLPARPWVRDPGERRRVAGEQAPRGQLVG